MSVHCPQCDTPYCERHGECQSLDITSIPKNVDFILYQINGRVGGTPVANVGGVEMHGDTLQEAINAASKEYRRMCAEEDAYRAKQEEGKG